LICHILFYEQKQKKLSADADTLTEAFLEKHDDT